MHVRLTAAWLWSTLALLLLAAGAAILVGIALSGSDEDEVALAVALIGLPALVGAFALGMLALVTSRPGGPRLRAVRRWGLATLGTAALLLGLAIVMDGGSGGVALLIVGATLLLFLARDVLKGQKDGG